VLESLIISRLKSTDHSAPLTIAAAIAWKATDRAAAPDERQMSN
jgi:hypothetical protein